MLITTGYNNGSTTTYNNGINVVDLFEFYGSTWVVSDNMTRKLSTSSSSWYGWRLTDYINKGGSTVKEAFYEYTIKGRGSTDRGEWFFFLYNDGTLCLHNSSSKNSKTYFISNCNEIAVLDTGYVLALNNGKVSIIDITNGTKTQLDIPYATKVSHCGGIVTNEGVYYVITGDGYTLLDKNIISRDLVNIFEPCIYGDIAGNLYYYDWMIDDGSVFKRRTSGEHYLNTKIGEGIVSFENGTYIGVDGYKYSLVEEVTPTGTNGNSIRYLSIERLGVQPYPRKEPVKITNLSSSAKVKYAFSTSENYEEVKADEWQSYDKNTNRIMLNPPASGTYYLHIKIEQDSTVYTYRFGPYNVVLEGTTVSSSGGDFAYMSGDITIPETMAPTFNIIFTPPSDMFLSNELEIDPERMYLGIVKNGLLNIKVYDQNGNDVSSKIDFDYVAQIYKNGVYLDRINNNYLFTKRDANSLQDNVYILRVVVGGQNLFTGVGNQYKLEFNGMNGYDSITMQNLVPVNTHKFALNVYVTELPNLT